MINFKELDLSRNEIVDLLHAYYIMKHAMELKVLGKHYDGSPIADVDKNRLDLLGWFDIKFNINALEKLQQEAN